MLDRKKMIFYAEEVKENIRGNRWLLRCCFFMLDRVLVVQSIKFQELKLFALV